MRVRVKYKFPIEIKKENGESVYLPMGDQMVEIIETEGNYSCHCRTVGFPWIGTFWIDKSNLEMIQDM